MHKIILFREDVLRTYLSSRRVFETGIYMSHKYQSHKIHVDLVDLQRFVNRYYQSYDEYRTLTQGHPRKFVIYETLCKDSKPIMKTIWRFLGVDQHIEPEKLDECIPQSSSVALLRDSIENYDDVEFACRHDPELSNYLDLEEEGSNPIDYKSAVFVKHQSSKADFCVLLDDDVIPMPHLLDAYLGVIMRSPNASVFVGSTHLPSPHNLLTHAIIASDIPG